MLHPMTNFYNHLNTHLIYGTRYTVYQVIDPYKPMGVGGNFLDKLPIEFKLKQIDKFIKAVYFIESQNRYALLSNIEFST